MGYARAGIRGIVWRSAARRPFCSIALTAMPVTRTITLYSFDELSEEAQEKAIERLWDLNVSHDWWGSTYKDAERAGLEIEEFDCDRSNIRGKLKESLLDCCKLIRKEHGRECDTYKTAKKWHKTYMAGFIDWLSKLEGWEAEGTRLELLDEFESSDEAEEITDDFRRALLGDYLSILRNEYDYLTSREQVVTAIEINEYLFTEDGVLS